MTLERTRGEERAGPGPFAARGGLPPVPEPSAPATVPSPPFPAWGHRGLDEALPPPETQGGPAAC